MCKGLFSMTEVLEIGPTNMVVEIDTQWPNNMTLIYR